MNSISLKGLQNLSGSGEKVELEIFLNSNLHGNVAEVILGLVGEESLEVMNIRLLLVTVKLNLEILILVSHVVLVLDNRLE